MEASTVEEKTQVVREAWSTERLVDELFLELDNVKEIDEKSDLPKRKKEDDETLEYVLKESIGRIFEGVDQRYFKLSVRRFLKCELPNARKLEG